KTSVVAAPLSHQLLHRMGGPPPPRPRSSGGRAAELQGEGQGEAHGNVGCFDRPVPPAGQQTSDAIRNKKPPHGGGFARPRFDSRPLTGGGAQPWNMRDSP